MPQGPYFKLGYAIVLIFLIIYLGSLIDFVFTPFVVLLQTVFAPIVLAGVLFYVFRPIVDFLHRWVSKGTAVLIIYAVFIAGFALLISLLGPVIQDQFNRIVEQAPQYVQQIQGWFNSVMQSDVAESVWNNGSQYISNTFSLNSISDNLSSIIGTLTSALIVLAIIPFVLFYMLKEGKKAPSQLLSIFPEKQREEGQRILRDMDYSLASYIQGQIIVSACVGVLVYISYLLIGIDYSLVLAIFAMLTNLIPFIGPWIGTIPGIIVALFDGWVSALLVIGAVVIIQQFESLFITPQIHGRHLNLHPITVIFVLLVGSNLGGIIGMILAVPAYTVLKVIVTHMYRLLRLRIKENANEP